MCGIILLCDRLELHRGIPLYILFTHTVHLKIGNVSYTKNLMFIEPKGLLKLTISGHFVYGYIE